MWLSQRNKYPIPSSGFWKKRKRKTIPIVFHYYAFLLRERESPKGVPNLWTASWFLLFAPASVPSFWNRRWLIGFASYTCGSDSISLPIFTAMLSYAAWDSCGLWFCTGSSCASFPLKPPSITTTLCGNWQGGLKQSSLQISNQCGNSLQISNQCGNSHSDLKSAVLTVSTSVGTHPSIPGVACFTCGPPTFATTLGAPECSAQDSAPRSLAVLHWRSRQADIHRGCIKQKWLQLHISCTPTWLPNTVAGRDLAKSNGSKWDGPKPTDFIEVLTNGPNSFLGSSTLIYSYTVYTIFSAGKSLSVWQKW